MTSDQYAIDSDQAGMELDPADEDAGANADPAALAVTAASLFEQALEQTRMGISIVDPNLPDSPMIYVNRAFTELTGYSREECLGRNCRFLQGPATDPEAVEAIRRTVSSRKVEVVEILNYRKDGSTFWNALHIGPVYDEAGHLTHLYGSQWDVTDLVEKRNRLALQDQVTEELQHRTKNLFSVIGSIVSLSARGETDAQALAQKIRARVQALGDAHAISLAEGRHAGRASDLHDLVSTILDPYQTEADAQAGGGRIVFGGDIVRVPRNAVTPLGLMLHELATNAVKHGALGHESGTVTVSWRRNRTDDGDHLTLEWVEEGGPPVTPPDPEARPTTGGMGRRMTESVLRTIGADIDYGWPPSGMTARLSLALDPLN